MFDPTIYDNLKVVFEGALYDLDHDKRLLVTGREDLVDLATMSRTFRMQATKPDGVCRAEVELASGLLDFAGELRRVRLAEEEPGCSLKLSFWLGEALAERHHELDAYLQDIWSEVADVIHERTTRLPQGLDAPGHYRITLPFKGKIDEANMEDVEPLLLHLVSTLEYLEEQGKRN